MQLFVVYVMIGVRTLLFLTFPFIFLMFYVLYVRFYDNNNKILTYWMHLLLLSHIFSVTNIVRMNRCKNYAFG